MQQLTATYPPSEPRRRLLTEAERAQILARIIDIITADPGQTVQCSEDAESARSKAGTLSDRAPATQHSGMV